MPTVVVRLHTGPELRAITRALNYRQSFFLYFIGKFLSIVRFASILFFCFCNNCSQGFRKYFIEDTLFLYTLNGRADSFQCLKLSNEEYTETILRIFSTKSSRGWVQFLT